MRKALTQIIIALASAAIIAEAAAIISIRERIVRIETLLNSHLHPTANINKNDLTDNQP